MEKILILYYSRNGSVATLANHIAAGVENVDESEAVVRTVPPISPICEATEQPIPEAGPPYVEKSDLESCAGIILGSPTRFGNMAAPLKYFLDTTGDLWFSGALSGKPAACFTSTATFHGGQESTLLSMMLPLLHHGMVLVGLPFTEQALTHTARGGTPYGASHISGPDNDFAFSEEETVLAKALGKRVATVAKKLR